MRRVVVLIELQFSRCSYTDFADVDAPATCLQGAGSTENCPRTTPFLERLARRTKARVEIVVRTSNQRARIDPVRSNLSRHPRCSELPTLLATRLGSPFCAEIRRDTRQLR